jgi:hypothetical protein
LNPHCGIISETCSLFSNNRRTHNIVTQGERVALRANDKRSAAEERPDRKLLLTTGFHSRYRIQIFTDWEPAVLATPEGIVFAR